METVVRALAVSAALLLALAALADEPNEEKPLGTVVVTATRTEQPIEQATTSISVVSEDDMQSRHAEAVSDVLRQVPGVDVSQSGSPGNSTSVFIRGADADQTLVLVDGVEMNSPTLGGFDFSTLNTDNLDRIEVLRGAGGTLYGSEAVGGVINLLTKRGEGAPQFSLLDEGGNGDTQRHALGFSGAHGPVGVSGSVSYLSTGGFRPVNDDFTMLSSSLRVDADLLEHGTLRGFFRSFGGVLGLFNNLSFLNIPDPNARFSDERYLGKIEWEHRPVDNLVYRLAGSVVHDTETFTDPDALTEPGGFAQWSQIPTQINTGETQVTYYEGNVGVTTGGFVFQEKAARPKSLNVQFDQNFQPIGLARQDFAASRSILAGYLQQQVLLLDDRLVGTGGFRVDSDEDFGRQVSAAWSLGYLQDWDGTGRWATRVKGGYAEGFNAPTFNELFFPGFGNPDLDAETSSEYNGGVVQRLWSEVLTLEGTFFSRRTKHLIQAEPVCGTVMAPDGLLIACNVGRADVRGVETGVTIAPLAGLSMQGTYTYLDFDVTGPSGRVTLAQRPHNRMAAVLRYQHGLNLRAGDALDLTTSVNYVGERHDVSGGLDPTYTVTNAAVTYHFPLHDTWVKEVAVFTHIGNLFDRNYFEIRGFKSPPINFVAGTKLTF